MPTYDYACAQCGEEWEQEQSIKDEPVRTCPKCGKEAAKRLITKPGGFVLKGENWARDSYGVGRK